MSNPPLSDQIVVKMKHDNATINYFQTERPPFNQKLTRVMQASNPTHYEVITRAIRSHQLSEQLLSSSETFWYTIGIDSGSRELSKPTGVCLAYFSSARVSGAWHSLLAVVWTSIDKIQVNVWRPTETCTHSATHSSSHLNSNLLC